jgi:Family of unknown function (DUF6069)
MTTNTEPAKLSTSRLSMVMLRDAMLAGIVAVIVTTVIAALAEAADVSLAVDSKQIPLGAFPFWTVVGAILGVAIAAITRIRRWFTIATITGTLLSVIPAIALPDDNATRVVLVLAHLAAAAIIIPAIARNLEHSTPA